MTNSISSDSISMFFAPLVQELRGDLSHPIGFMQVGISYESDLKKAIAIALNAAMSIDRILKVPEPKCLVKEFGDSTVNLQLRAWINDPQNGMANVKDAVLLAVWDGFHENGIEIVFPQRDLHIKDAVPVKVLIDR